MTAGDLKSRLRAKFTRRYSITPSVSSSTDGELQSSDNSAARAKTKSLRSLRSRGSQKPASIAEAAVETSSGKKSVDKASEVAGNSAQGSSEDVELILQVSDLQADQQIQSTTIPQSSSTYPNLLDVGGLPQRHESTSALADYPTPNTDIEAVEEEDEKSDQAAEGDGDIDTHLSRAGSPSSTHQRPPELSRRQSLLPYQQTRLIKTLLETEIPSPARAGNLDYFTSNGPSTISPNMVTRKIWVKRPHDSATLVPINEDDLVDDVRDNILKKYGNSLGRTFDAPDVTLRLVTRDTKQEKILKPDEPMSRTLDSYYPGGQSLEEALVIDVPTRRTPKPSPRGAPQLYYVDDLRPGESGTEYFPPMPLAVPSPRLASAAPVASANGSSHHLPLTSHSMSVINTGQVPSLPSPGGSRRHYRERPRAVRTHTSSPVITGHSQVPPSVLNEKSIAPPPPPLPTPPAQDTQVQRVSTPPPRVSSPRPNNKPKKTKKLSDHPNLPAGLLNGAVPPINVLIVEDNIINLRLLEAFMKRLKVRWQTAMNGKEAVTKWRAGGFHLVLMDIQLPVMNGLDATREIRRLEKLNSIGVFSSSASSSAPEQANEPQGDDKLPSSVLFKSPVIIVALTASSLQSDRHEALAAGCNDFLTKPVNFVWLERKVMEWGCMQALIDFDGWRKWKDFSEQNQEADKKGAFKGKAKKNRMSLGSAGGLAGVATKSIKEEAEGLKA